MATSKKPPWQRPKPKSKRPSRLSDAEKELARERAKRAGRRYPNLVDNLWVIAQRNQ